MATHWLPPLLVYILLHAQRLVLRPSPVSPYSPLASHGFKWIIFVLATAGFILLYCTSPLRSWLIHLTIYSATPLDV